MSRRGLLLLWLAFAAAAWLLPGVLPRVAADEYQSSGESSSVLLFSFELLRAERPVPFDGWLTTSHRALPLAPGPTEAVGRLPLLGSVWPEHEPSDALAFFREVPPLTYVAPRESREVAGDEDAPAPRDVAALHLLVWAEVSTSFYGGL